MQGVVDKENRVNRLCAEPVQPKAGLHVDQVRFGTQQGEVRDSMGAAARPEEARKTQGVRVATFRRARGAGALLATRRPSHAQPPEGAIALNHECRPRSKPPASPTTRGAGSSMTLTLGSRWAAASSETCILRAKSAQTTLSLSRSSIFCPPLAIASSLLPST